jgi:hypothetical protein
MGPKKDDSKDESRDEGSSNDASHSRDSPTTATAGNLHHNKKSATAATEVTAGTPTTGRTPPTAGWLATERQRMTIAKTSLSDLFFLA